MLISVTQLSVCERGYSLGGLGHVAMLSIVQMLPREFSRDAMREMVTLLFMVE